MIVCFAFEYILSTDVTSAAAKALILKYVRNKLSGHLATFRKGWVNNEFLVSTNVSLVTSITTHYGRN